MLETKIGDILESIHYKSYVVVIKTFEKEVFKKQKQVATLNTGKTYINTAEGLAAAGFRKWIPQSEQFVILIDKEMKHEFKVYRIKTVIEKEKRVILYNGTKLKFSEIEPFIRHYVANSPTKSA